MPELDRDVLEIVERISTLQEPYRQNAVEWLEEFMQNGIEDVGVDMPHFLGTLKPIIRRNFTRSFFRLFASFWMKPPSISACISKTTTPSTSGVGVFFLTLEASLYSILKASPLAWGCSNANPTSCWFPAPDVYPFVGL